MRTIQVGREQLKISAGCERALHTLNRHDGACSGSDLWSGSGRFREKVEVDESIGVVVRDYARDTNPPPWVREFRQGHPRARVIWAVSEDTWSRFDSIIQALRAK